MATQRIVWTVLPNGVVVLNRIKPHTDFSGTIESGLLKMLVVGLGKREGAAQVHKLGLPGLARLVPEVGRFLLERTKVVLGQTVPNLGAEEYKRVVDIALAQPIAPKYLAFKLVRNFAYQPATSDLMTTSDPLVDGLVFRLPTPNDESPYFRLRHFGPAEREYFGTTVPVESEVGKGTTFTIIANKMAGGTDYRQGVDAGIAKVGELAPSVQTWDPKPDVYSPVASGQVGTAVGGGNLEAIAGRAEHQSGGVGVTGVPKGRGPGHADGADHRDRADHGALHGERIGVGLGPAGAARLAGSGRGKTRLQGLRRTEAAERIAPPAHRDSPVRHHAAGIGLEDGRKRIDRRGKPERMQQRHAAIELFLHRRRARRHHVHRAQSAGRRAVIVLVGLLRERRRTNRRHHARDYQHADRQHSTLHTVRLLCELR